MTIPQPIPPGGSHIHPEYRAGWNAAIEAMQEGAAQDSHGWQPIETAPKDGAEILAWRDDCGILMIRWCSANELSTMSDKERDELDEESLFQENWWGGDADQSGYRLEGSEVPTHWQPLPDCPQSGGQAMSGGAFNYAYQRVRTFAEELGDKLAEEDEQPGVHAALIAVSVQAAKFAEVMRAVEWYYSADIGPETLLERLEKYK